MADKTDKENPYIEDCNYSLATLKAMKTEDLFKDIRDGLDNACRDDISALVFELQLRFKAPESNQTNTDKEISDELMALVHESKYLTTGVVVDKELLKLAATRLAEKLKAPEDFLAHYRSEATRT